MPPPATPDCALPLLTQRSGFAGTPVTLVRRIGPGRFQRPDRQIRPHVQDVQHSRCRQSLPQRGRHPEGGISGHPRGLEVSAGLGFLHHLRWPHPPPPPVRADPAPGAGPTACVLNALASPTVGLTDNWPRGAPGVSRSQVSPGGRRPQAAGACRRTGRVSRQRTAR